MTKLEVNKTRNNLVVYQYLILSLLFLTACAPSSSYSTLPKPDQPIIAGATPGYAEFGEYKTYYEQIGNTGLPVLLIHGIGGGSSVFQYRKNAQAIADAGYRVWAIDLLGFGRSSRPAIRYTQDLHRAQIESFIRDVIQEKTNIVANGVAAAYTIRLAAQQPDLVRKLILIGPTGLERQTRPQNADRVSDFNLIAFWGDLVYGLFTTPFGQRFFLDQAYYSEASFTPEVVETYDYNLKAPNAQWVVYSFATGSLDQDVRSYWAKVQSPTLLLWGEASGFTSAEDAKAFVQARPEVTSIVIPKARLLPNEDNPEAFNTAVLRFLGQP